MLCDLFVKWGLAVEFPDVEVLFNEGVDWDGFESHWPGLNFKSHYSVPADFVVEVETMRDDVLSRIARNKECEFRSLQYRLISEGECEKAKENLTKKTTWHRWIIKKASESESAI